MPIEAEENYLGVVNLLGNRIRLNLPFTNVLHLSLDIALLRIYW